MRLLIITFLFGLLSCSVRQDSKDQTEKPLKSQESETTNQCSEFTLTEFLKTFPDYGTDGVFDTMYQRIQFHFDTIQRSQVDHCIYFISGFDRLKGLVTPFNGTITIKEITKNVGNIYERETPSDDKLIEFSGSFIFRENKGVRGSGFFQGNVHFKLTLNNGKLLDDMGEYMGDGFSNFIYQGTWTNYTSGTIKKCIWGQGRLPDTGDFDQGVGDRFVNDKYKKNGWEMNKDWEYLDNPKEWWKM